MRIVILPQRFLIIRVLTSFFGTPDKMSPGRELFLSCSPVGRVQVRVVEMPIMSVTPESPGRGFKGTRNARGIEDADSPGYARRIYFSYRIQLRGGIDCCFPGRTT